MTDPLADEIDEDLWNEASGRADVIRSFLKEDPGRTSAADIVRLAEELDLSRASVFRLIKLFREGGTVMSLVERKRGRPVGHRTLDAAREEIIHAAINRHHLKRTRPSISQLVRDVQTDCLSAGLAIPVRRRTLALQGSWRTYPRPRRRHRKRALFPALAQASNSSASHPAGNPGGRRYCGACRSGDAEGAARTYFRPQQKPVQRSDRPFDPPTVRAATSPSDAVNLRLEVLEISN